MARALWKGSVSFGLVNIPIELHGAVRDHRPRFRLLHAADNSPIRLARMCAREGRQVDWKDLVKGYEYAKGHFVVLTEEDFRQAALEKTRRIEIMDFVTGSEIDDRFFETPYYVLPVQGGAHAYALLREAMRAAGRVGIAKIIMRDVQHLAALEVIDQAMVLTLLRFADELADIGQLPVPPHKAVAKSELDMAKALVESLATEWKPGKYTDEDPDNLMRVIRAKAKGKKVTLEAPVAPHRAEVIDLMERLRRSLDRATPSKGSRASAHRSRGAARKPRKHRAA